MLIARQKSDTTLSILSDFIIFIHLQPIFLYGSQEKPPLQLCVRLGVILMKLNVFAYYLV